MQVCSAVRPACRWAVRCRGAGGAVHASMLHCRDWKLVLLGSCIVGGGSTQHTVI